ncbi:hypothetical protein VTH82DRAFT_7092 [Thermothelomyces myriococcoides]
MGLLLWTTTADAPYPGVLPSFVEPPGWDGDRGVSSSTRQHLTRTSPGATLPVEPSCPPESPSGPLGIPAEERYSHYYHHYRKAHRSRLTAPPTHPDSSNSDGSSDGTICLTSPSEGSFNGRRSRSRGQSPEEEEEEEGEEEEERPLVSSRRSSTSTTISLIGGNGTRRRPPSLERQGAFRDERTAKRRRRWGPSGEECGSHDENNDDDNHDDDNDNERCRIRLLLADKHDGTRGFAPDRTAICEGHGRCCRYHCRLLPTWRPRGPERCGGHGARAVSHWRHTTLHEDHQLAVINELAIDDFFDDVSLPDGSFMSGEEDGRSGWAMLGDKDHANAAAFQAMDAMVDAVVVETGGSHRSLGCAGP